LGITEDRTILANIEMADVATATFSDAAFHPFLQRGIDAFVGESEGHQFREGEFDHNKSVV
jgi:hypothetical protein